MASNEQRRRQLAREKFERQQQRRDAARRKARRRNAVIAAGLAVVVAAGAGAYAAGAFSDGGKRTDAAAQDAAPSPKKGPDPCAKPAPGSPSGKTWKSEPEMSVDKSKSYAMELKTTCGAIDVKLDAANAPHTVNSFDFLAKEGFFDHSKCHRLTTAGIYVLQCGDPKGTGMGGPGYTIEDENLKDSRLKDNVYPAGTIAMANTGQPHTGGSQFFLVYQDSQLPPQYTPFGTIGEEGMKTLKKIADAGERSGAGDGAPNATVVIDKATVAGS
ncbi:peptidylprolyl isomerase [Streptomyces cinnamoneus]|uniref:Peptidylprolyl isomerase n=1 Tax=Streptomyces cinnamoneus TaxID=53446 RepID=A0A2G1XPV1_STRCJ|nr:peptidylprolyl isomerase [Streptomyces cinnamoneus]PHQ53268.1 peptidylprolyl isomerase [Streptomyces cinnamoneus]PPT12362.1 peptidylprolyl isomerase [Streptomyces cinnamoneus]